MWTRAELKQNAKTALSRYYWTAFAVCLLYGVMSGGSLSSSATSVSNGLDTTASYTNNPDLAVAALFLSVIVLLLLLASVLVSIFVGGPLIVGYHRFFMESREHPTQFSMLFWGFRGGRYWKNVKVIFLMNLKIVLWTLLLFIPGVIKTYEYYMIPYLLAENPDLETDRYFQISRSMTDGEKMNIWVLGLSFIGWMLLGALLCGVGTLFVVPYVMATDAELYALMRAKALSTNISDPQELPGFQTFPGGFQHPGSQPQM